MTQRRTCPHCGAGLDDGEHECPDISSPVESPVQPADLPGDDFAAPPPYVAPLSFADSWTREGLAQAGLLGAGVGQPRDGMLTPGSTDGLSLSSSTTTDAPAVGLAEPEGAAWAPAVADARLLLGSREVRSRSEVQAAGAQPEPSVLKAWGTLLLTCYASALTLVLCWLIVTGRVRWGASRTSPPSPSANAASRQAEVPVDQVTTLGRPLRVGDLELTPVTVRRDDVVLRNQPDGEAEFRKGGVDALWLLLRVRNLSQTETFAPLDAGLAHAPAVGEGASFVQTDGDPIPLFPAADSDGWVIDGQEFPELGPGEARELKVVSAPNTSRKVGAQMTWRQRIRTAPGRTTVIGITFSRRDIP